MGRLTTHVLDTARGRPAEALTITLARVDADGEQPLVHTRTNADGRCDGPLLEGDDFRAGRYELIFQAGEYFRRHGTPTTDPAFLDDVVIRFGVGDPRQHYHVPLLLSPFGYTTYKGS